MPMTIGWLTFTLEEIMFFATGGGIAGSVWFFIVIPFYGVPCNVFPLFCGAGLYFFIVIWGFTAMMIGSVWIVKYQSDAEYL